MMSALLSELDDVIKFAQLGDFKPLLRWSRLAQDEGVLSAPQASEEQMLALEHKFARMLASSDKGKLWHALAFYADPETYRGAFSEDFSYDENLERVPGKLARDTLDALQKEAERQGKH
jgi:hypothetical protein